MSVFEELRTVLVSELPGFRIGYKDESRSQALLGGLLATLGSSRYLTDFTTVLPGVGGRGPTVWFPTRAFVLQDPLRAARILLHERVHLHDLKEQPATFVSTYLLHRRAHWERRAYTVDIALARKHGHDYERLMRWLVEVFSGPDYLYMWRDPAAVQGWVARVWRDGPEVELDGELLHSTQRWLDRL